MSLPAFISGVKPTKSARSILAMIGRDFIGFVILAALSLGIGLLINQFRRDPLPLVYESKAERLTTFVASIQAAHEDTSVGPSDENVAPPVAITPSASPVSLLSTASRDGSVSSIPLSIPEARLYSAEIRIIDLDEFQQSVEKSGVMIIDARPEIFHRLGHVPHALPLPRDDFATYYQRHRDALEASKERPIIIYCSGSACEDGLLVATALQDLGFRNLAIFSGGWSEWSHHRLPEEK
jgi:rhodanese-related sulfurtransferase